MPCCSGELLSELVPLRVVQGMGGAPGTSRTILQTGRAAHPCSWLGPSGAEGFGCLAQNAPLFAFFSRLFLAAAFGVCLRLLAACWWHREAVNGKAPAGMPLCVLSLGKLLLSSCSTSFCGSHLVSTIIPSGHGEMCHLEDIRPRSQQVLG